MSDFFNVSTAAGSKAEALEVLRSAVRAKLAASGQVSGPVAAAWWHEGEYGEGEEWVVVLKTNGERRLELEKHLAEVHPWGASAEVTVVAIGGSEYYLNWISRTTAR